MRVKTLAQAIAAIGLLGSGFAHAADDNQLERVTITGSNIKRISKEGALPVEVLKKEDIEKTGASTTVQLLESLTSTNDVISGTNSSSFAAGAATVGLRGMSSKYVLVLLNGRRLPNYAMFQGGSDAFVDLNSLPISMIDSVEILRDGASAIYGSDAVAGVINFKTKRNFQGTQISTRYGQTEDGDGMEQSAGVMGGIGDKAKDGYNLLWEFNAYHREPVSTASMSRSTRWTTAVMAARTRVPARCGGCGRISTTASSAIRCRVVPGRRWFRPVAVRFARATMPTWAASCRRVPAATV